jgi:uncharacterized protein YxeA
MKKTIIIMVILLVIALICYGAFVLYEKSNNTMEAGIQNETDEGVDDTNIIDYSKYIGKASDDAKTGDKLKVGKYLISYNVNFLTEESKEEIGHYYDGLALIIYEDSFKLIFGEGYCATGKYEIGDTLMCKSQNISWYNRRN